MKKTLAILLAVVMLLSSFCILPTVSAEENDNAAAAITISSEEDFLKIGNDNAFPLNGDYKLGNNITVRSVNYAPIGSYTVPLPARLTETEKRLPWQLPTRMQAQLPALMAVLTQVCLDV